MNVEKNYRMTKEEVFSSKERAAFVYEWLNKEEREELYFYSKKIRNLMDIALERAEKF